MLSPPEPPARPAARSVRFDENIMTIELQDGRELGVPLEWSVLLRDASREALNGYVIDKDGDGIHWPELDEDLRVVDLLYPHAVARRFH